jgi:thymidylate kinase
LPSIFIEGVDGSGKSTLALTLAGPTGRVLESPPEPYRALRHEVAASPAAMSRLCYFLAGNHQAAALAAADRSAGPVVVVRHLWSTIAYFSALEGIPVARTLDLVRPLLPPLEAGDRVVYLSVSPEVQERRLRARSSENALQRSLARRKAFQERVRCAFDDAFRLTGTEVVALDSSATEVARLAAAVSSHT